MLPDLHHTYTREQAIAAFPRHRDTTSYCDGEFVVLSKAILCFATVGDPKRYPHVPSPTCFVWKPRKNWHLSSGPWSWLPEAVREAQRLKKKHHLFVRSKTTEHYWYLGTAHLGSYGEFRGKKDASYSLDEKITRDLWLALGGFSGWEVEVNHSVYRLESDDDKKFLRLLKIVPRHQFSHVSLTRYEQDSLHLHTNGMRGWLMYLRSPADSGLYTRDTACRKNAKIQEEFECACGISLEFPRHQTLPKEDAVRVVRDFFATGELPDGVPWSESWD